LFDKFHNIHALRGTCHTKDFLNMLIDNKLSKLQTLSLQSYGKALKLRSVFA
jgi:hypothetical protein